MILILNPGGHFDETNKLLPTRGHDPLLDEVINRKIKYSACKVEYKKFIKTLTSFEKIKDAKFPTDLYLAFGKELSEIILMSFVDVKKGRTIKNFSQNERLTKSLYNEIESRFPSNLTSSEIDEIIEVDWTLGNYSALHSFRAEAFEVAGVNVSSTLDMLKTEAEKAFTKGTTFADFKKNIALKGFESDRPYILETNFVTARNNAYHAAKWQDDIMPLKDVYPYLRYAAIMDDRVRDEHAAWNGHIEKVDSEWWDENYPPNGWRCRCSVEQLTEDEAKKDPEFGKRADPNTFADPDFRKNAGKDENIWKDWLDRKETGKQTVDSNSLEKWKDQTKKATEKAPDLLKLKNNEEYKEHYDQFVAGSILDSADYPLLLDDVLWDHISKKGARTQGRLEMLDYIHPTIKNADEIWLQENSKGEEYFVYFKAFKNKEKGGFACARVEKGKVVTFFEPDKESYFDKNRFGELIYKKK